MRRRKRGRGLAAGIRMMAAPAIALAVGAGAAGAETCLEQTQRLAKEYNLSIEPAEMGSDGPFDSVTTEELSKSGGVIAPPVVRDPSVVEPPESPRDAMPTVPAVPPGETQGDPQTAQGLSAAARTTLESLLMAARAEAKQQREEDCFERLNEAKAYVQRQLRRSRE